MMKMMRTIKIIKKQYDNESEEDVIDYGQIKVISEHEGFSNEHNDNDNDVDDWDWYDWDKNVYESENQYNNESEEDEMDNDENDNDSHDNGSYRLDLDCDYWD